MSLSLNGKTHSGQCMQIHTSRCAHSRLENIEQVLGNEWIENWEFVSSANKFAEDTKNDPIDGFTQDNGKDTAIKELKDNELDTKLREMNKASKDLIALLKKEKAKPILMGDVVSAWFQSRKGIDLGSMKNKWRLPRFG